MIDNEKFVQLLVKDLEATYEKVGYESKHIEIETSEDGTQLLISVYGERVQKKSKMN